MQSRSFFFPATVWLITLLTTTLTVYIFDYVILPGIHPVAHNWLLNFASWDGEWYSAIARKGYYSVALTAFFPVYPLLIKLLHAVTGCKQFLCGILVANISFLLALMFFYKLLLQQFPQDKTIAERSLWILAVFPTALFFNMTYTESTSLLFIILFFFCLQQNNWYQALLWGGLATLTHDLNVVLSLSALAYLFKMRNTLSGKIFLLRFFSIAILPLSLCFYMVYLWIVFGSPIEFVHAQTAWGRVFMVPVYDMVYLITHIPAKFSHNFSFMMEVNVWITLLFIALIIPLVLDKRITLEQKLFYIVTLLASIISGTNGGVPESYGRFMLVLFPGYILLAQWARSETRLICLMLPLLSLKVILTGMFADGYWVT